MLLLLGSVNSASSNHVWRLVIDAESEGQHGETIKPCAQERQSWANSLGARTVSPCPQPRVRRAHTQTHAGLWETIIASPLQ